MTTTPPPRRPSEARSARRTVLVAVILVPVLVVAVLVGRYIWDLTRSDDWGLQQNADSGNSTAWQSRAEATQVLRDTAAVTGLEVSLRYPGLGEKSCSRSDGKDGTSYSLDDLIHQGRVDSPAVIAAVAAYWKQIGLSVSQVATAGPMPSDADIRVSATTSTGALLEVGSGPGATTFSGYSGCALVGGGPTPLPKPTLLPVGSGVPSAATTGPPAS